MVRSSSVAAYIPSSTFLDDAEAAILTYIVGTCGGVMEVALMKLNSRADMFVDVEAAQPELERLFMKYWRPTKITD